ncbi:homeodomain-interacting protein kinase 1-like [Centropristis striata]|uniref:homeodomain-interacting protein kinase 1-like n=1 Tax=Centropristis striata TaxID=184440 RepID=UPI0027DED1C1|nr:homeodomain-interacting protein kinase 1-like [Centropristis striata]
MNFSVSVGDVITSPSSPYVVQHLLGSGAFGAVTQCKKITTNEIVALKIIKDKLCIEEAKEEAAILQMMKKQGSDNFNVVRWNDSFTFEERFHLEFEKLDMSLYEFQQTRPFKCLELKDIRPILQQVATALEFLKNIGLVHADLKPENIMIVDHFRQPLRVKVIDFGLTCNHPEAQTGVILQSLWYRSPEILLGSPFNEAIDVWSLGCIAAEMLTGKALFAEYNEYDTMRSICYTVGKPTDRMLNAGRYTRRYFRAFYPQFDAPTWKLMSSLEVRNFASSPRTATSLSDLLKTSHQLSGEDAMAIECDRISFVDLLTKLLTVDPSERITPSKILQHPFITKNQIFGAFENSAHVNSSVEQIISCCNHITNAGPEVAQNEASTSTASLATHPEEGRPAVLQSKVLPILQSTTIKKSLPTKRKRDGDKSERVNNPDTIPAKRRRIESQDAAETDAKISLLKSLPKKRKRGEAESRTSEDISPPKQKRRVNLDKEPFDSIQKLLSNKKEVPSSLTTVHRAHSCARASCASGKRWTSSDEALLSAGPPWKPA